MYKDLGIATGVVAGTTELAQTGSSLFLVLWAIVFLITGFMLTLFAKGLLKQLIIKDKFGE